MRGMTTPSSSSKSLLEVVELGADRLCELGDDPDGIDVAGELPRPLRPGGEVLQDLEVDLHLEHRARPANLHHHGRAVGERRRVGLADRGRCHRPILERGEDRLRIRPQLRADHRTDLVDRHRRRGILELRQLGDERRREEIRSRGQELAELDERRAEFLECGPEVRRGLGGGSLRRVGCAAPPGREDALQSEEPHDETEPVASEG